MIYKIPHTATDCATQTPSKPGVNLGVPEGQEVPAQLVHMQPSCYSCYKLGDKSCMKKLLTSKAISYITTLYGVYSIDVL